jgi:hypothetical protein
MKRHCLAVATAFVAIVSGGVANASEFVDGVIVVSDSWCAPNNDGFCNVCNTNRLIKGAKCTNSYCDNMILQCANPPVIANEQTVLDGPRIIANVTDPSKGYGWTSDENGANSTNAICPTGYVMVGAYSTNSYSDNVRTACQHISRSTWSGISITVNRAITPISDEVPNNQINVSWWLTGTACTGNFCDNMYYSYAIVNW